MTSAIVRALSAAMSAGALATTCGVPRTRIERLANEETGIAADTALLLTKALSISVQLWLNLQNAYDVQTAEKEIGKDSAMIEPRSAAARTGKTACRLKSINASATP